MRIARLVATAAAAAALAVFTSGAPALAHNSLTKAVPAKNATVKQSPGAIELSFLQTVDAEQLSIEVADAQGTAVQAGEPAADGKKGTLELTSDLPNGTYTVTYRVVSEDGHPVKGSYRFTVDAPAGATSTSPPAPSAAAPSSPVVTSVAPATLAASTVPDDGPNWALIIGIVAALIVITVATVWLLRRTKTSQ